MKKILSVFLALVMVFTMTTIAFAAVEEPAPAETTTEASQDETTTEGGSFDPNDLPLWTVKVGLKVGKVIIKIVAVIVKVGMALGIIDSDELLQKVQDLFGGNTEEAPNPEVSTTVAAQAA